MEYPINGSVVIVDDKPEEIEGLIRVLASKGVPTLYFNEEIDKIPTLNGIRIIFLDLDLKIGVQDTPEPAIISTAIAVLNKLIVQNNGGYILVLWSTLIENYADAVIKVLNDGKEGKISLLKEYPIDIIKLDKNQVSTKNGTKLDFDIDLIYQKINSIIAENNILNLINYWENIVVHSSKKVINNFDNVAKEANQKKKLLTLFADSISQTDNLTNENIISSSLVPISALLADQLSAHINSKELNTIANELLELLQNENKLDINEVSKINTFYHMDSKISCNNAPGTVFNYKKFMDEHSCSSKECDTKWSEGLLSKLEEDFNPSNMDIGIGKQFTNKYESTKGIKMPYIEQKDFQAHIDIAEKKGIELNKVLHEFNGTFSEKLEEEKKKQILKSYSQNTQNQMIQNLIQFVFKNGINNSIIDILNEHSKDNKFDLLNEENKKEVLEKYYLEETKKTIMQEHNDKKIPIFLEFSPDCDFVQKNRKKLRLIFGLMYPYSLYVEDKKNFNGENYIYTPIIEYNGQPYKIVLDLHTVTGINEDVSSKMETMFRFRKELLVDIQQKIASHIARPGFFNMNDYLK